MTGLTDRSRRLGYSLRRTAPGSYRVHGDRWRGAVAVCEAVTEDTRAWTGEEDDG